jgi:hypothetical protein
LPGGARSSAAAVRCAHCDVEFVPSRAGHIYHSPECRYKGPRLPGTRRPVDHDQIRRLFDEGRDPDGQVRDDDWHPNRDDRHGATWIELDASDTVGRRRWWYRALVD